MSTALGKALASWRAERGLSLRDCARHAGFSYQHVRRLERGEQVPSIEVLWKLSQILGLGLSQVAELAAEAHADSAEGVAALSASKAVLTSSISGAPSRATTKL